MGFTALAMGLLGEDGERLTAADEVAVLVEAVAYLGFHPSVLGRAVFVEGESALVERILTAEPSVRRLNS